MIASSICLIVTASPSRISSTQAASHGAGHRRPVNSGKLLVACSCAIASSPAVAVDEVVPVGDQVAERAAVVAERHAAVHAARALLAQLLVGRGEHELAVVVRALARVPLGDAVALDLQEAAELAHQAATAGGAVSGEEPPARSRPPVRAARACSRGASPSRTRRAPAAPPTRRARAPRRASRCARRAPRSARAARSHRPALGVFEADHAHVAALARSSRPRRARRRSPPLMPAAKLRPVGPSTTTRPPVMYSQPWSPTPSTTAHARRSCARRSARPRGRGRRPGRRSRRRAAVLPTITFSSATNAAPCPRAGAPRAPRRTGPCRCSRWRRRAA